MTPAPPDSASRRPTSPARYAVGMFGTSIPINVIKGSMLYFYVSVLGMDLRAYAAVYTVYGVIDAIDNPIFGHISDRTRSRWGRRKPYLIVGALVLMCSMAALFWVPDAVTARTTTLLVAWFAVFAILSEASDSLINANYGALLPELFPQEKRRALANSLRQGFQLVAMVLSLGLTPLLTRQVLGCEVTDVTCSDPTVGYRWLSLVYGVLGAGVIIFMALGVHENTQIEDTVRPRFLHSIRDVVTNRYFWTVGLVSALYGASMALLLGGLQFYVRHSLGGTALDATILQVVVILASVGFLVGWTAVVRRLGAARTWRMALPIAAASFLPLFLARDLVTGIIAGLCVGFGYAGLLATNDLIMARVLDDDARRTGVHREGIFLSAFGVLGRLSAIPTSVALLSLGWFFGYRSGDVPGADPGTAWRVYMSLYPFAFLALGSLISRFIHLPADASPDSSELPDSAGPPDSPGLPGSPAPGAPRPHCGSRAPRRGHLRAVGRRCPMTRVEPTSPDATTPAGQRNLVLTADDFGYDPGTSALIVSLLEKGCVSATTVLAVAGDLRDQVSPLLDVTQGRCGLHAATNSDRGPAPWRPLSSPGTALADPDGLLPDDPLVAEQRATPDVISAELHAQMSHLLASGLTPVRLDSHSGTLYGLHGNSMLGVAISFCAEHRLGLRLPRTLGLLAGPRPPEHLRLAHSRAVAAADASGVTLPVEVATDPRPHDRIEDYADLRAHYVSLLRSLPEGTSEIFLHPGADSPWSRAHMGPAWRKRLWEARLLEDPHWHRMIEEEGINLVATW